MSTPELLHGDEKELEVDQMMVSTVSAGSESGAAIRDGAHRVDTTEMAKTATNLSKITSRRNSIPDTTSTPTTAGKPAGPRIPINVYDERHIVFGDIPAQVRTQTTAPTPVSAIPPPPLSTASSSFPTVQCHVITTAALVSPPGSAHTGISGVAMDLICRPPCYVATEDCPTSLRLRHCVTARWGIFTLTSREKDWFLTAIR